MKKKPFDHIGEAFSIGKTSNYVKILFVDGDTVKVRTYAAGYRGRESEKSLEEVTKMINS
jgi:nicotinamide riboside kinase